MVTAQRGVEQHVHRLMDRDAIVDTLAGGLDVLSLAPPRLGLLRAAEGPTVARAGLAPAHLVGGPGLAGPLGQ